ncbi:hypothetical protein MUK42_05393 [Musa troglodytarum]|uniref:DUF547 domain-containing protein n=1 Tax=Musa troglodytarum TaxID=320322 RepID=A0A9E7EIM0_9LILI|nr:hypothetical protein MUK42_05393 [Musa troglodytarum]
MLHSAQAEAVAAATTSWRSATTVVSQSLLPMPWESRATVSNIEVYVQPVRLCAIKMICSEFEIHCAEDDRFDFQVAELQRVLRNEEKMHEVLEHAMLPPKTRSTLQIPGFLPRRNAKVENVLKLFREPSSTINLTDQNAGNYHPNKLSEKILNFLICIFLRLSRMSRALDLEKSSNLSKSANLLLRSGSFEIDGSSIRKGRIPAQREIRHHDPYGIFEIEGSILRDIGPYKNLIKFTSSSLDDKDISNSLPLLKKLRLREVDLRSLRHQEKLAFWINVYHTCIMHGSLELGMPSNPEMVQVVKDKALLDVGGSKLNARAIEHLILRQPFNYNEDDKEVIRRNYGLEHSDPNIVFALCSGCKSSPAVRIYTADGVTGELEKSKLDYLQASIAVTANRRVMIPHFLFSKMHDFATDLDSLAEWIIKQLPTSWPLRKSMLECFKGHTDGKTSNMVDVIPNDSEFQYLLRV